MTENLNIQRALLRHLDQYPGVELMDKTKVEAIEADTPEAGEWPVVTVSNGRTLRARLLVREMVRHSLFILKLCFRSERMVITRLSKNTLALIHMDGRTTRMPSSLLCSMPPRTPTPQ